ncbi:TPA: hypothetical protein ACS614_002410 [Klebsiella aerogenes]
MSKNLPTTFDGLSLQTADALKNITSLIEVGCLLTASNNSEHEEIGDAIFWLARNYAAAAYDYAIEGEK